LTEDHWRASWEGDAETRERLRREFAEREAALVTEQTADLPDSDEPNPVSAIDVSVDVPNEENVWRYTDAGEPSWALRRLSRRRRLA
jgi:hypothetical protein